MAKKDIKVLAHAAYWQQLYIGVDTASFFSDQGRSSSCSSTATNASEQQQCRQSSQSWLNDALHQASIIRKL